MPFLLGGTLLAQSEDLRVQPPTVQQRLQAKVDALQKAGRFPGLNVAVLLKQGQSMTASAGVADRASQVPMGPDHRMPAGSVGKTFVSAVALQLVKEGKLALEAKVSTYLGKEPWFQKLPNSQDLTVRMLLNHSSGLSRHEFKPAFHKALGVDLDRDWKPQELLAFLHGDTPLFPAGQGFAYSDSNYILLGIVMEKIAGRPYYELLRERLLQPLALVNSTAPETRAVPKLAQGYAGPQNPFGGRDAMVQDGKLGLNPKSEWTGGGVVSTPTDLARWARHLYTGRAIDVSMLPVLLETIPAEDLGPGVRYGLGVIVRATELGPCMGHSGFFPGYRTQMAWFPEKRLAVALQVNTSVVDPKERPFFDLVMEIAKAVLD